MTITKHEKEMPEDEKLSSGYSVVRESMVKIDNYQNVLKYRIKKEYNFLDKIEFLEEEQYPQGLCITEEYIFISSYSGIRGQLGKIKVFDRNNGKYLLSLGMDPRSHMGGLAYDGKDLWICNSSKMSLERLSYAFVQQMTRENEGKMIDARNLVEQYQVGNIPSSVTFFNNHLWVSTHSIWTNSTMMGYQYNEKENVLNSIGNFRIPSKVQGVTFSENGEVYLSTSYGRKNTSNIKRYKSIHSMSRNVEDYIEKIEIPPCAEGVVHEDGKLYVIFESAGKKYLEGTDGKGKCPAPLDKILVISTS